MNRNRRDESMQPAAQDHGKTKDKKPGDNKRCGEQEKWNPPPPPSPMPVGEIADDRREKQVGEIRKRDDHQSVDEFRNADPLDEQRRGGADRSILQSPGEISPQQPEPQQDQASGGIGQASRVPQLLLRRGRRFCAVGLLHRFHFVLQ